MSRLSDHLPPRMTAHRTGDTWIDPEPWAYGVGLTRSPRSALVYMAGTDDRIRVRVGVPDTFFAIPALAKGNRVRGYVSVDDGRLTFHPMRSE